MRSIVCAGMLAVSMFVSSALAETPAPAVPGMLSVQATPISEILKSDRAKAVLEKELPGLRPFYRRISDMTLAEVARASHGLLGAAKLKAVQAGFDTIR